MAVVCSSSIQPPRQGSGDIRRLYRGPVQRRHAKEYSRGGEEERTQAGRPAVVSHPHPSEREVCEMRGNATMPAPVPQPPGEALSTLAHELRDPLAAILFALELPSGHGDPP